jgi:uncharacterized membrane protein YeaQ/YmgE (transglycosylase-associated protein family)
VTLEAFVIATIVGVLAGVLADFVMKGEGNVLIGDVLLGVGGSLVGSWLFRTLGSASDEGWIAMVAVALVGAVIVIAAQRITERTLWVDRT